MARRRFLAGAVAMALAGCSALTPRLVAPEVVGTRVRVAEVRLPDVRLGIELDLRNPNARDVALDALDASLSLGGEDIGRARLARPVTLPANGEARVALDVRADASAALARLGAALGAGRPLDYEVRGTLRLADGATYPFRRRGEVPAGAAAR